MSTLARWLRSIFALGHSGPNECGPSARAVPGCNAKRGTCCEHCPVAYQRSQS